MLTDPSPPVVDLVESMSRRLGEPAISESNLCRRALKFDERPVKACRIEICHREISFVAICKPDFGQDVPAVVAAHQCGQKSRMLGKEPLQRSFVFRLIHSPDEKLQLLGRSLPVYLIRGQGCNLLRSGSAADYVCWGSSVPSLFERLPYLRSPICGTVLNREEVRRGLRRV